MCTGNYGMRTGCLRVAQNLVLSKYGMCTVRIWDFMRRVRDITGRIRDFMGYPSFRGIFFFQNPSRCRNYVGNRWILYQLWISKVYYFDGYIPLVIPQSTHVSLEVLDVQWHCDFITPMGCELQVFSQPQIFHHFWEPSWSKQRFNILVTWCGVDWGDAGRDRIWRYEIGTAIYQIISQSNNCISEGTWIIPKLKIFMYKISIKTKHLLAQITNYIFRSKWFHKDFSREAPFL